MTTKPNNYNISGEYYFSWKLREIEFLKKSGRKIFNLAIGNPDLPPAPEIIESIRRACLEETAYVYQPHRGNTFLRTAIAEWYFNKYNVDLDPDHEIIPVVGSKSALHHVSDAYLDKGDTALAPNPGYPVYISATRRSGARVQYYSLNEKNNWLPDLTEIKNSGKIKLIWLNYPHMPTGIPADINLLSELIEYANHNKIIVCHDNPYSMICADKSPFSIFQIPASKNCAIEINSISKSHNMAGCRIGMICAKKEFIEPVFNLLSNVESGMFYPLQRGARAALKLPEKWYTDLNQIYIKRKKIIYELLEKLECKFRFNSHGIFVWAKIPEDYSDSDSFCHDLLHNYGIFITPGHVFGSNGERYVRVSACSPVEKIKEALQIIKKEEA